MATSTAARVAVRLINLSHDKNNPISNLKLQKLLYYSQAWFLAIHKKPLFEEDFEAWVHGPVIPAVFRLYRDHKWAAIPRQPGAAVQEIVESHVQDVWRVYGKLKAFELERLTHAEKPWRDARKGLPPDASSQEEISKHSMQKFYSSRLDG